VFLAATSKDRGVSAFFLERKGFYHFLRMRKKRSHFKDFSHKKTVENCDKKTAGKYVRTHILTYSTKQSPS